MSNFGDVPFDHAVLHIGSHFTLPWQVFGPDGEPFDFTDDPAGTWVARMEVRDRNGALVTRFHSTPAKNGALPTLWPGTITLDAVGGLVAELTADNTGSLIRGIYNFDLELVDPADGEPRKMCRGRIRIDPSETTND